ncbi:serine hydrolase domain-containing protein [Niabella sp.]|uniref:serine hydrolase domain-containing protein n=1 Tax=Niabella sp. TaxID=1962976 RepID=UPI0026120205|nr:serine hydrolase domain-containing protein [Niabella sp.]
MKQLYFKRCKTSGRPFTRKPNHMLSGHQQFVRSKTGGVLMGFLLQALLAMTASGQVKNVPSGTDIDAFVRARMKELEIPGMAVAVIKNGKVVHQKTYGFGNLEWQTPLSVHSDFQIASCTKLLTSTLLIKMLFERRLSLEDPVSKYIDSIPVAWQPIKIKHLITHSSGLRNFSGDPYLSTAAVVRALKDSTLEYTPGTGQHYAQMDFMLLGYILEKIGGKSFPELLREEVLIPLGMTDGGFDMETKSGSIVSSKMMRQKVTTYYKAKAEIVPYKFLYPQFTYTAGGYFASLYDLTNWVLGLDRATLFPQSFAQPYLYTRDSMQGKVSQYTKAGWILEREKDIQYTGHSGGPGLCDILRFRKEGYTFIVMSNDGELLPTFARALAALYIKGLPAPWKIQKFDRE